jgi:hypothetical protein
MPNSSAGRSSGPLCMARVCRKRTSAPGSARSTGPPLSYPSRARSAAHRRQRRRTQSDRIGSDRIRLAAGGISDHSMQFETMALRATEGLARPRRATPQPYSFVRQSGNLRKSGEHMGFMASTSSWSARQTLHRWAGSMPNSSASVAESAPRVGPNRILIVNLG